MKWLQMKADDDSTGQLHIYQDIGDTFDGMTAKDFVSERRQLGEIQTLEVRINSMGGSMSDGFAIYSLLREDAARINVVVDGLAASIASVIAMAGDEIRMAENAFMMVHKPWTFAAGNANDMRARARELDQWEAQAVNIYASRSNLDASGVRALLEGEDGEGSWLDSAAALTAGLADTTTQPADAAMLCLDRERFPKAPACFADARSPKPVREAIQRDRVARKDIETRLRLLEIDSGHTLP